MVYYARLISHVHTTPQLILKEHELLFDHIPVFLFWVLFLACAMYIIYVIYSIKY